jgi:Fur family ferric uptake transcriptional regulator
MGRENKLYKEIQEIRDSFASYLKNKSDKGRRKTEVRDVILQEICAFKGHFDIKMLHDKLQGTTHNVTLATLYNTLNVLIDAGLIVRHHFDSGIIVHQPKTSPTPVMYELRKRAETHLHFICTQCHCIKEVKKNTSFLKDGVNAIKDRFTPEYISANVYGICRLCRSKMQKMAQENETQSQRNNNDK